MPPRKKRPIGRYAEQVSESKKRAAGELVAAQKGKGEELTPKKARSIDRQVGIREGATLQLYKKGDQHFYEALEATQKILAANMAEAAIRASAELNARLADPNRRETIGETTLLRIAKQATDTVMQIDERLRVVDGDGFAYEVVEVESV
jgi:hypothetical protein